MALTTPQQQSRTSMTARTVVLGGFALAAMTSWIVPTNARAQITDVSNVLSTPDPTPQAQNVYDLLTTLENNARNGVSQQTIIGQHDNGWYETATQIAGKSPGFVELDFGPGDYQSTYDSSAIQTQIQFAENVFNSGEGIVGFSFHQSYPGASVKSYDTEFKESFMTPSWYQDVITPGTAQYNGLISDLTVAANGLQELQQAGVPVLFRPYFEMNKAASASPFWWADTNAAEPGWYQSLWNLTYNFMENTEGLHNLIWVWSPYENDGTYGTDPSVYYPGSNEVDVVGNSIYDGNPPPPISFYNGMAQYNKPRIIAETDMMPVRGGDSEFAAENMLNSQPWVIDSIWANTLLQNVNDSSEPNVWNTSDNDKAIHDTYDDYNSAAGMWQVLSGGPNGSYNFSWLVPEPSTGAILLMLLPLLLRRSRAMES